MTPESNRKGKAARGKKYSLRRWIVDWTIEPAAMPGYVNLSLLVASESDESVRSSTNRHYLMQQERIADLIRELTWTLEHSDASRALEEQALAEGPQVSAEPASGSGDVEKDQPDLLSSHFSLGAYGLVGN
ncbi:MULTISPECIES: hypothetical protein [Paraburkholderia]|nr:MULTISPECIES: hypothetical protein [Paraburkholderia]MDH6147172.1 hypothetical protein [Paraburkholderia sp. WSM4179]